MAYPKISDVQKLVKEAKDLLSTMKSLQTSVENLKSKKDANTYSATYAKIGALLPKAEAYLKQAIQVIEADKKGSTKVLKEEHTQAPHLKDLFEKATKGFADDKFKAAEKIVDYVAYTLELLGTYDPENPKNKKAPTGKKALLDLIVKNASVENFWTPIRFGWKHVTPTIHASLLWDDAIETVPDRHIPSLEAVADEELLADGIPEYLDSYDATVKAHAQWVRQGWWPRPVKVKNLLLSITHRPTHQSFEAQFPKEELHKAMSEGEKAVAAVENRRRPPWLKPSKEASLHQGSNKVLDRIVLNRTATFIHPDGYVPSLYDEHTGWDSYCPVDYRKNIEIPFQTLPEAKKYLGTPKEPWRIYRYQNGKITDVIRGNETEVSRSRAASLTKQAWASAKQAADIWVQIDSVKNIDMVWDITPSRNYPQGYENRHGKVLITGSLVLQPKGTAFNTKIPIKEVVGVSEADSGHVGYFFNFSGSIAHQEILSLVESLIRQDDDFDRKFFAMLGKIPTSSAFPVRTAGCENLPNKAMQDNCEAKKEEGKKQDSK